MVREQCGAGAGLQGLWQWQGQLISHHHQRRRRLLHSTNCAAYYLSLSLLYAGPAPNRRQYHMRVLLVTKLAAQSKIVDGIFSPIYTACCFSLSLSLSLFPCFPPNIKQFRRVVVVSLVFFFLYCLPALNFQLQSTNTDISQVSFGHFQIKGFSCRLHFKKTKQKKKEKTEKKEKIYSQLGCKKQLLVKAGREGRGAAAAQSKTLDC